MLLFIIKVDKPIQSSAIKLIGPVIQTIHRKLGSEQMWELLQNFYLACDSDRYVEKKSS